MENKIPRRKTRLMAVVALLIVTLAVPTALAKEPKGRPTPVRFATFNASLNRFNAGDLLDDLSTPDNVQAQAVAEIVQRTRPAVLLVNEFDFDEDGTAAQLFPG